MAERQVSSSSIGNGGSGRFTTPIDEEGGDIMFSMEGMDDEKSGGEKRNSGGWTFTNSGGRSPHLGVVGSRNGVSGGAEKNGNGNGNGAVKGVEGMFGAR
jgi:hypothetical protein